MKESKKRLLEVLENDPFNLLEVKQKVSNHRDIPKMVLDAFEQINEFYRQNNREPQKTKDRAERTLCAKLEGIIEDANQMALLKELDEFHLLEDKSLDIFTLKNVTRTINMPDYFAKRKVCKDFEKFEALFKECHNDLATAKREITDFRSERFIKKGLFFIIKGVMGYVAEVGKTTKINNKRNARLRCIFENGAESDMLLRSLSAEFYKDGKIISALNSEIEEDFKIQKEDKLSGYIYVLKSLSQDERIKNIQNLYKIGYSTTKVQERIKNAKNEPTYLMADVEIVKSFQCFNLNTQKLEKLLHQFFGNSCLDIKIIGNDKKEHTPREWFIAPLDVIKKVVQLVENEEIIFYRYDKDKEEILQK